MSTIREIAEDARPKDDADWGTDRQIDAINLLWIEVMHRWPDEFDYGTDFSNYCLKATDDEQIDLALKLLGDRADLEAQVQKVTIDKIKELGGTAYVGKYGFLTAIPLGDDWMFGRGADLESLIEAVEASDGLASETDGIIIKPYLTETDALDEVKSYVGNDSVFVTGPQKGYAPSV